MRRRRPRPIGLFRLTGSLTQRLSVSFRTVMILMLLPALASMAMMLGYSRHYHRLIVRAEQINSLLPLVTDELPNELFGIVAGRKRFDEGDHYASLAQVREELDRLIAESTAGRPELTVARRAADTLANYIDILGGKIRTGSSVDEQMLVLEEVRNVSALLHEMFTDAVSAEIRASTDTSLKLQLTLAMLLALETALVLFALAFIRRARGALVHAVADPIERLREFAGQVADGHLDVRAPQPDVDDLRALSESLNTMAVRLETLIEENRREQENLKKSELRALQAQVTPHFLYNTLDAIVWLAEAKRMSEVIAVTRALSDFFRISLSDGRDWISVAQEEEHLKGYLTIQKVRYRDILDYDIHIDPAVREEMILKLSIQPLVENAIYHGIKNRRGGGKIDIRVWKESDMLCVRVLDNGAGMGADRLREIRSRLADRLPSLESGYGLFSVDKRIKLYYNLSQGLEVTSTLGQGSSISFRVPLMNKAC